MAQTALAQTPPVRPAVGWGAGVLAGAGAGIVAAVASVAVELAFRAQVPPLDATAWSAFVAGVVGGIVYAGLSRVVSRPVMSLWILALTLATIDSVFIAVLPFPAGSNPRIGIPIVGLIVPIRQAAALLGIGRFSEHHFPAASLAAVTAVHYVTAVAVALLVPLWAGRKTP